MENTEQSPAKPVSLRRNFAWTFVGNMIYAGSSWGILVVLAKMGSPVVVGAFALGLALTTPVILLASLQLRAIQATDASYEYLFRDYLGLRLLMLVAALLVILGLVLISGYESELAFTIMVIGVGKIIDNLSDIIYGLLQRQEQMDRISISYILKGILSLLFLAAGHYLTDKVLWAAVGWTLASLTVLLLYDLPSGLSLLKKVGEARQDSFYPRFHLPTLTKLFWLALPLGVTLMIISLNSSIPRYFLERYYSEGELGIFSAMAYLVVAGTTVVNALGQSATPKLAQYYANRDVNRFYTLALRLLGIGVVLATSGVVVAVVAGRFFLTLFYKAEYAEHADVFVLIMLAGGISYVASFLGYLMTSARYFKAQLFLFGAVAGATALGSLLWIPEHGIMGAAWVMVFVAVVQVIGSLGINLYALYQVRQYPLKASSI